jgi:hypothetical protein
MPSRVTRSPAVLVLGAVVLFIGACSAAPPRTRTPAAAVGSAAQRGSTPPAADSPPVLRPAAASTTARPVTDRTIRHRRTLPHLSLSSTVTFRTPHYFPAVVGDTYFNTVDRDGAILATSDDSRGANGACTNNGGDIAIVRGRGPGPGRLRFVTVNCMSSYGPRGGGRSPDGCSWKTGGITRVGRTIYLAVARQLRECSAGRQGHGLQPSFNASIIRSVDGGKTWINAWGQKGSGGAAPPWSTRYRRYRAMFPGQSFSAPFFIQYGPGNTRTVDDADKYLYAVSNDGYAYNGNYLRRARVPLDKVQIGHAWRFYHGEVGGRGRRWTPYPGGATKILREPHELSQPAIQYVPALHRYLLITFFYPHGRRNFPTPRQTTHTRFRIYTAPKPWGPWTRVFGHDSRRTLWCTTHRCTLTRHPGWRTLRVGRPHDRLGLYDPALVQKFLFTRPLGYQALFTSGDFKNKGRYRGEDLYRLHAIPINLRALLRR